MTQVDAEATKAARDEFPLLDIVEENKNPASALVLSALRTASLLDRVIARALTPFEMHHAQFNTLMLLRQQGTAGLRPSGLGNYLCVSRPNVTKLLSRLKSRGLAEERPDPMDGRAVLAYITPEGERLCEKALASLSRDLESAVSSISEEDGNALRDLLARFRDGLTQTLIAAGCERA